MAARAAASSRATAQLARRAATLSAKELALNDTYGRLKATLERLGVDGPDGRRRLPERMTHADLGARVGCTREMIGRLMKDLVEGGYVALDAEQRLTWGRLPERW